MTTITRAEILRRANAIPRASQFYSMETIGPHGYRPDCSGWVSYAWNIPPNENGGWGGQSTVSLVTNGYMSEIPWSQLQPGDAIGHCGPGTAGADGHIILVMAVNGGTATTLEFCGDTWCPAPGSYTAASGYRAYRYNGVQEISASAPASVDELLLSGGNGPMYLIKLKGKPEVFLSNGMTSRWLPNPGTLADVKTLAGEGLIKLVNTKVREVTNRELIGVILGKVPAGY